jgi:hypothetical protein
LHNPTNFSIVREIAYNPLHGHKNIDFSVMA